MEILRQVALEIDPSTYVINRDEDKNEPSSSMSRDTCSLSSSVFSDTVNFTADYQLNTPKHGQSNLAKTNEVRLNNHNGYASDDNLVDYGVTTFSTFKGPNVRNRNEKFSKDKVDEDGSSDENRKFVIGQKKRIGRADENVVDGEKISNPNHGYRNNDNHLVSNGTLEGQTFSVTSAKSWQDVTGASDYSIEMLRRDDSINPTTMELSIVDEKTANDTNNNLEPDLFDGVEREKVGLFN